MDPDNIFVPGAVFGAPSGTPFPAQWEPPRARTLHAITAMGAPLPFLSGEETPAVVYSRWVTSAPRVRMRYSAIWSR